MSLKGLKTAKISTDKIPGIKLITLIY